MEKSSRKPQILAALGALVVAAGVVTAVGINSSSNEDIVAAEATTSTSAPATTSSATTSVAVPEETPAPAPVEAPAPEAPAQADPAPLETPVALPVDTTINAPVPHAPAEETPAQPQVSAVQVANPLNMIGALAPTGSFQMDGPFGVGRADYAPMAYQLPLNPPGPQASMVRWVDGWGVAPQHAQHGTLYILGHAWAQQRLVFNPFAEKVTASVNTNGPATMVPAYGGGQVPRWQTGVLNGTRIHMTGANGVRREWVIDNAYLIRKTDSINDIELNNAHIPGRIVLIACAVGNGQDLPYNVIVTGHLS